ncbi:MAG: hypothetical protein A3G21_01370 [Acidobacteria bacterium RIFCSPLOWO2_12_FULL_66_21]|nr:MAG: hypothetical protein A3G21_01370 [Acidobacteria bacterium RIFCSPLOWO2_12_FULL_66_21]
MIERSRQARLLGRVFFYRLLESDVMPAGLPHVQRLIWSIVLLSAPGLAVPLLFAPRYGRLIFEAPAQLQPAIASDRLLLITIALAVMGLTALMTWDGVLPDRRDARVLSPLPVAVATQVTARLGALALLFTLFVAGTSIVPSIGLSVMAGTYAATPGMLRGAAAQCAAVILACGFGFFSLLAMHCALVAALGRRSVARAGLALQVALAVLLLQALLMAPWIAAHACAEGLSGASPSLLAWLLPPAWFFAVYETLAGTGGPAAATLARFGAAVTAGSSVATVLLYIASYRRVTRQALETPLATRRGVRLSALSISLHAPAWLLGSPVERAVCSFTLRSLARSRHHRLLLALYVAVGITLVVSTATPEIMRGYAAKQMPGIGSAPFVLLFLVLSGMRALFAAPIEPRANWVVRLCEPLNRSAAIDGVRRAMVVGAVLPIAVVTCAFTALFWGIVPALHHAVFSVFAGVLLAELLLRDFRKIPFTCTSFPTVDAFRTRWPWALAGFLFFGYGVAILELGILGTGTVPIALAVAAIGGLTGVLARKRRRLLAATDGLLFAETDPAAPFEGFSLSESFAASQGELTRPPLDDRERHSAPFVLTPRPQPLTLDWSGRYEEGPGQLRIFHGIVGDIRFAVRRLAATPLFVIFAVVSLGIGIGVTTAVYSVLASLLWKPIGVADAEHVVLVAIPVNGRAQTGMVMSRADFDQVAGKQKTFRSMAASTSFNEGLAAPSSTEILNGQAVTGGYFDTLGVRPFLGRMIQPEDEQLQRHVIVLGYWLWRTRFAADPDIVGRIVRVGSRPFEIIGIAPASFVGLSPPLYTGGWVPLGASDTPGTSAEVAAREARRLTVIGRLRQDRSLSSATAELASIGRGLDAAAPLPRDPLRPAAGRQWFVRRVLAATESGSPPTRFGLLIIGLVALVLVVACTNLANLMLARGTMRQHELAVRRALGASRWRIVRELTIESGIIAGLGGFTAYGVTRAILVLSTTELPTPRGAFPIAPELDLSALLIAAGALLLSVAVFGLEPALQLTRSSVSPDLTSPAASVGAPRSRRQRALVRWQVAISTCFFLVAAILVRVVISEARHDPGIALERLGLATVHFRLQRWDEAQARRAIDSTLAAAARTDGIESVAASSGMPFGMTMTPFVSIAAVDKPFSGDANKFDGLLLSATTDIFRALGVPIVRGRPFDQRDGAGSRKVAVVSEQASRHLFGTTAAIDREFLAQEWGRQPTLRYTVVGVARDTDTGRLMSRREGVFYVPFAQNYTPNIVLVARTRGDPSAAARVLQNALQQTDPDLATGTAGAAPMMLAGEYVAARVAGSLAAALGALTMVLAMIGLYGVQSHLVTRRRREVGLRMALGASVRQIRQMVMREGLRPVAEGLLLGLFLGVVVRMGIRAVVPSPIRIVDPVAYALVPIPLILAALAACYLPARRASRVDPNVALRDL